MDFLQQLADGVGFLSLIAWVVIALIVGSAGGAVGGMLVGAAAIGRELAAMMGAFYGTVAAVPGIVVAYLILMFI